MIVTGRDRSAGSVRLNVSSPDDAWFLYRLLRSGDVVKGRVWRKVKMETDAVKKSFFIAVRVERCEYLGSSIRVLGVTVDEHDDVPRGSHQSLTLDEGSEASLQKDRWSSFDESLLVDACKEQPPTLLVLVLDRESAVFASTSREGFKIISQLKGQVAKKHVDVATKEFFPIVAKELGDLLERFKVRSAIVASPSFWKEDFFAVLPKEVQKSVILVSCSTEGIPGVREVLQRSETKSLIVANRIAVECAFVGDVLERIRKGSKVAYGMASVVQCASAGAVEKLLVSSKCLERERSRGTAVDDIFPFVDSSKGRIILISSEHDGGAMLDGLGGIAAVLRFDVS